MSKNSFLSYVVYAGLIVTLFAVSNDTQAQISEGGMPQSFSFQQGLKSEIPAVQIPIDFSVEDMKTVDAWQVSQGAPLKVARFIPSTLSIAADGNWVILPNGKKIWQLRIRAEGATALMLCYKSFYIPAGGKLFIYNADKSQVLGAYTDRTNPPTDKFATEFVAGDDIILEYEADAYDENPILEIEKVGYGYNHLEAFETRLNPGPGGSAECMVNINCTEGEKWQDQKKGITEMIIIVGKYGYFCSGSLVNNTNEDQKPYILSASHCISNIEDVVTDDDLNQYIFYFHFERTGCSNLSLPKERKTMVGCTKVVNNPLLGGSDGLLLLLNQNIPDTYDVYFNGWDRSNTEAHSGVGIHHPNGDYMKISTFGTLWAKPITWYGDDNVVGAAKAHWNVIFDKTTNGHGVTEGGSSGSPLFNENKLIVGTLSGGSSSCEKADGSNLYGKLYYHWNKEGKATSDTARMDKWLDPQGKGVVRLAGRQQTPAPVSTEKIETGISPDDVSILPALFGEQVRISNHDRVQSLDIISIDGKLVQRIKHPEEVIQTGHLASGIYIFRFYTDKGIRSIQGMKK